MRDKILWILGIAVIAILTRDILVMVGLPAEKMQGAIFKIIFFHVPMAMTAMEAGPNSQATEWNRILLRLRKGCSTNRQDAHASRKIGGTYANIIVQEGSSSLVMRANAKTG